jgi:hypothetical protein
MGPGLQRPRLCAHAEAPQQAHRTIGPAWPTEAARAGYFTKRTAQAWLRYVLDQARPAVLSGMARTGVSFADACGEYLRYLERPDRSARSASAGRRRSARTPRSPAPRVT